ncbi:hypothetical protein OHA21_38100 [Actinoplanes sp. NBC_00393]|uniref:hypothetical protein n=1 Tax=Actinoplanes sp. NBC_00393 TaxID=2975953 RepID=UPI002E2387DD
MDWSEVEEVVTPVISTWSFGSELAWVEHAWGLLGQRGLATYTSEIERTRCILRALAVSAFYLDFCARAFGEGSPDDWREKVNSGLLGPAPLIDVFTLGQLIERDGFEVDNHAYDDGEQISEALGHLVAAEYPGVVKELRESYDDARLFASMFLTSKGGVEYPLADERIGEVVNHDVTGDKMHAWVWLTEEL